MKVEFTVSWLGKNGLKNVFTTPSLPDALDEYNRLKNLQAEGKGISWPDIVAAVVTKEEA